MSGSPVGNDRLFWVETGIVATGRTASVSEVSREKEDWQF